MSQYTCELRQIVTLDSDRNLVTVFDDLLKNYPLFNESYRKELNAKIVEHYYFYEVGFETADRFVFEINRKMNELMLYYNKLYLSEIEINPLINYKKVSTINESEDESISTTGTRDDSSSAASENNRSRTQTVSGTRTSDVDSTSSTNNQIKDVKSDTPTSQILGADIDTNYYASEASVNNSDGTTTSNELGSVTESQTDTTTESDDSTSSNTSSSVLESESNKDVLRNQYVNEEGVTISESELLLKFRETFLNIDLEIIEKLQCMFMQIM